MPEYALDRLRREAERWWASLPPGSVVWLSGELGTGKTTLVRAIARAAGVAEVRSPTFALVHEYPTPAGPLIHVDCYRLRDPAEALDLDFPDLARRARLLMIEWPERAGRHAPAPDLHLRLSHGRAPDQRVVERVA